VFGCLIINTDQFNYIQSHINTSQYIEFNLLTIDFDFPRPNQIDGNFFSRVQFAPLIWVGDQNHSLLIYIFGNFCNSTNQYDSTAWGDDNVGSTSLVTLFSPACPIT
jgi:hypothetical protein